MWSFVKLAKIWDNLQGKKPVVVWVQCRDWLTCGRCGRPHLGLCIELRLQLQGVSKKLQLVLVLLLQLLLNLLLLMKLLLLLNLVLDLPLCKGGGGWGGYFDSCWGDRNTAETGGDSQPDIQQERTRHEDCLVTPQHHCAHVFMTQ